MFWLNNYGFDLCELQNVLNYFDLIENKVS